ncbi:MAG TPA: type II secretion system major pseudopilin GspG [Candidatus Sumerlaeota bacterium]|nr:type II secretion system major pseudopilin GspG [Candidatus Sumerlaeota bacterium]
MNHRLDRRSIRRAHPRGFTLVEIILVVVIVLTLAAVVTPRLVGKSKQAKINTTKIQMNSLKTSLQNFEINAGRFPTTAEGLEALVRKPSGLSDSEWPEKYVDKVPKDAWGNPFEYTCPSEHDLDYDLVSAGPDGQFGSEDDIANYDEDGGDSL